MTILHRDETAKILQVVKAVYPKHFQNYDEVDMFSALIGWHGVLKDYNFDVITAGLQAYLAADKKGFPPSPGQIVDMVKATGSVDEELTATEAWALVKRAIRNGIYGSEEEFARLPNLVQRALGSADIVKSMAAMPSETVNSVEQSHFIAAYNRLIERKKQDDKVPENVRAALKDAGRAERLGYAIPEAKQPEALPEAEQPEEVTGYEMTEETSRNIEDLLSKIRGSIA
ncbi:MAG: replicative helicase loader/inhibitor [Eubacteriales bacterium]|nr:replicative helicase loader/inhibitor [Eubacteriales bacterium]